MPCFEDVPHTECCCLRPLLSPDLPAVLDSKCGLLSLNTSSPVRYYPLRCDQPTALHRPWPLSLAVSRASASDTEAFLMQGIRWRVLDLSYCPDRMSSWKELAQVSAWVNFDRFLVFFSVCACIGW